MKTKFVYVLISGESDFYLEQLLMSTYSLRLYHPNDSVIIITDSDTEQTIKGKRAELRKYVSKISVIDVPKSLSKLQRSRYLKTHLRQILDGDFLFIDTDTIICESLSDIEELECDLGAVAESNSHLQVYEDDEWIMNNAKKAGCEVIGEPHFNSGVFYVKDTPQSYGLYEKWYKLWNEFVPCGVNIDQLSLTVANQQLGYPIKEIPGIWNCQILRKGLPLLPQAKIIHYLASNKMSVKYLLGEDETFMRIKESGSIPEDIKKLIKRPRTAFSENTQFVGDTQIKFLKSNIYHIYLSYPSFYKFLDRTASIYLNIRALFGKVKTKVLG